MHYYSMYCVFSYRSCYSLYDTYRPGRSPNFTQRPLFEKIKKITRLNIFGYQKKREIKNERDKEGKKEVVVNQARSKFKVACQTDFRK